MPDTQDSVCALQLIFSDVQTRHAHVKDLTMNHVVTWLTHQVVLAKRTANHHLVRRRHHHQMVAWMSLLPSRILPVFLPQTLGLAGKAVRRRRQVAIVAILRETCFEVLHLLRELGNRLQGFLQRRFQLFHLLIFVHTPTVLGFHLEMQGVSPSE